MTASVDVDQGSGDHLAAGPSRDPRPVRHPPVGDPAEAGAGNRSRRPVLWLHLAVVAGYLAVAVLLWWRVWVTGSPSSSITCPCGDPSQELWWLQWLPWAILHGHNPFFTHAMNAGMGGVNGLANPSLYLPAAVAAPITVAFGPVVSFNVMATVTPVLSGWCMFVLCRRLTTFVPGQVLAGALWGFSPFMIGNLPYGRLNLVTGFFLPLAGLVCVDLVVGTRRHPRTTDGTGGGPGADGAVSIAGDGGGAPGGDRQAVRLGLALAGLVVAQFSVSTELLVDAVLVGAVAALTGIVVAGRRLWERRRRIGIGAGVAAGVSAVVLAYPAWYAVAGPASVSGDIWGNNGLGLAASGVVSPGPYVHTPVLLDATVGYFGPGGPDFSYLGVALVVFLAVSAVRWYRRPVAWVLAVTGVASWVFAQGQPLHGARSAWGYLSELPLLSKVQPQRFADFMVFSAAGLLAVSLDAWAPHVASLFSGARGSRDGRGAPGGPGARRAAAVVVTAVGIAVLVPIAASYSLFVEHPQPTPGWYTTVGRSLPVGTTVLSVPVPTLFPTNAMVWQAQDDFRFHLVGGYAIVPGPDGHTDSLRQPFGGATGLVDHLAFATLPSPTTPGTSTSDVRDQLERWGVDVVVVSAPTLQPTFAATYLTAVLGRPPVYEHRAWAWYGLGTAAPLALTPSTMGRCAATARASSDPLAGPSCIMATTMPVPGV